MTLLLRRQWIKWMGAVNILYCITKYLVIDQLSTRKPTTSKMLNMLTYI